MALEFLELVCMGQGCMILDGELGWVVLDCNY